MSMINKYVNIHRRSRTKFMSIADFNSEYNANLPSDREVEAAFHSDVRKRRRMTGVPVRGALYNIARELGVEEAPRASTASRGKFSMRPRRMRSTGSEINMKHKKKGKGSHKMDCSCNDCDSVRETPVSTQGEAPAAPVRRMGMRLSKINISRPVRMKASTNIQPPVPEKPNVMNAIDDRRRPQSYPHFGEKHKHKPGHPSAKGGHKRHSHGGHKAVPDQGSMKVNAVEPHDTFTVQDAREFYEKHAPEFLETHNLRDVVQKWNCAPLELLMPKIRARYGQAPLDLWSLADVKAFYRHYDPQFLEENNLHAVMTEWSQVEPSIVERGIRGKYGSVPGEPFKVVHWTPTNVTQYYNEVYPAKLQEMSPEEIIADWNRYPVDKVMAACKSRYGKPPMPDNYSAPQMAANDIEDTHIDMYKRALEDSAEHFDATKILHFVPTNRAFGDFSSHAMKMKGSAARLLIDGKMGPFKMFNKQYKTFKSVNIEDVNAVMRAIKQNRTGDFFIRVEE